MKSYRVAIVGLTGIAARRAEPAPHPSLGQLAPHSHAAAYAACPSTQVVAVCDLVPSLVERFRLEWVDLWPGVRGYSDYRQMLEAEEIDILSVATSDHRHAQIVVDAAQAGVRGILCEKPIATTLADADRMIAACRARGVPLLIDHTRRWYPEYSRARQMLASGTLGPLRRIVATLAGPRAMLFRNGTHLVDAVCYFADSEPAWVSGQLDDEHLDYGPRYRGDGGHDPASDPGGSAVVGFENGVRAFINASKGTMRHFEVDLWTQDGRLRLGNGTGEVWRLAEDGRPAVSPLPPLHTSHADLGAAVRELIGLVENGGQGSSTGEDGRRALAIILAMLQSSAAGGQPVHFPINDA